MVTRSPRTCPPTARHPGRSMRFRFALSTVALLAVAACQDTGTAPRRTVDDVVRASPTASVQAAGSYIVVLASGTTDVDARARELALEHGGDVTVVYHHALRGFAGRFPAGQIASLRAVTCRLAERSRQRCQ